MTSYLISYHQFHPSLSLKIRGNKIKFIYKTVSFYKLILKEYSQNMYGFFSFSFFLTKEKLRENGVCVNGVFVYLAQK